MTWYESLPRYRSPLGSHSRSQNLSLLRPSAGLGVPRIRDRMIEDTGVAAIFQDAMGFLHDTKGGGGKGLGRGPPVRPRSKIQDLGGGGLFVDLIQLVTFRYPFHIRTHW